MGIPSIQSSKPLPMINSSTLFPKKRSNWTTIAERRRALRRDFSHPYCNCYLTAPCRPQRDRRTIGSVDAKNGPDERMGRTKLGRLSHTVRTDGGPRTISAIVEFREVNQWQLISRRRKRKRSAESCTSSSAAARNQSRAEGKEPEAGDRNRVARGRRFKIREQEKKSENLRRTKARERRGTTEKDRSGRADNGKTQAELYAEARRRNIPGRSRMTKSELERALH
jgi:hypothetical protein